MPKPSAIWKSRAIRWQDIPRTCYIDGAWNQDDPEQWLSIIQIPIE
jgi:hypothetical protein